MNEVRDLDIAERIVAELDGRSLATAESCTAGRVATTFAAVADAAEFFRGGLVAYHEETKRNVLGVTAPTVFSEAAAAEMAASVCTMLSADISVATTGVAGETEVGGVDPGTVFVATCVDGQIETTTHRFDGDPEEVCEAARDGALADLARRLGA